MRRQMIDPREIDLNLLVIFQEVFQERQISSVARKLELSQPAVSNALARLRRSFNDELFVRTTSGMQPTPLALQLSEPIAQALHHVTQALNFQEEFNPAVSARHFRIAMTDVGEVYFMPVLVELCASYAPHIRISTIRASSIDLMSEMEAGRVDLAVGAFDKLSGALYQRRLFKQNYVTMMRKEHMLAGAPLSLKEFLAAQHLVVASRESPYERINQSLEKAGIKAAAHFEVPHFIAVPYIISTTDLLVTVPEKLAHRAAAPFNLHFVKPPLKLPGLQTNLFWHRRFNQDQGNQWLRSFIFDHLAE
jgi:DNA-binding transcriptional LysR family regulator